MEEEGLDNHARCHYFKISVGLLLLVKNDDDDDDNDDGGR